MGDLYKSLRNTFYLAATSNLGEVKVFKVLNSYLLSDESVIQNVLLNLNFITLSPLLS